MNSYFGDTHLERNRENRSSYTPLTNSHSHESTSDIIMDELKSVLIFIDIFVLITIPLITWLMTDRTLRPIQQAHDREKRFFTDASHDLRTPLTILRGEIEIALRKDQPKQVYKQTLKSNKEEIEDLILLVENMLFFAKENKRFTTSHDELIDLTDIIAGRVSVFQNAAKQKNIKLDFGFPKENPQILANTQLIKRLISILLDNAIKYNRNDGKVTLRLYAKKNKVFVEIKDTGIGIPSHIQDKIFDRFFRADSSRNEKGYGLGLSIAKQIIDFYKGELSFVSTENNGTTFTLAFPSVKQSQGKNLS